MNTQGAVVSKPEPTANSESGADPAGAGKPYVPSRTRRFFIQFEIGIKRTKSSPVVDLQPRHETANVQPLMSVVGGPRPPALAADVAAPVLGNPVSLASTGSGSSTSTSAVYVNLSAGDTATPPDSGDGLIKP
jgi:hypothetical protein